MSILLIYLAISFTVAIGMAIAAFVVFKVVSKKALESATDKSIKMPQNNTINTSPNGSESSQ